MRASYDASVEVDAPAAVAWPLLREVGCWNDWTSMVIEARQLDLGPLTVGSRIRLHRQRTPEAEWTLEELDPGGRMTWARSELGVRTTLTYTVTPVGEERCRITIASRFSGLLAGAATRSMPSLMPDALQTEAEQLKQRFEWMAQSLARGRGAGSGTGPATSATTPAPRRPRRDPAEDAEARAELRRALRARIEEAIAAAATREILHCTEWLGWLPYGAYQWIECDGKDVDGLPPSWEERDLDALVADGFLEKLGAWVNAEDEYHTRTTYRVA